MSMPVLTCFLAVALSACAGAQPAPKCTQASLDAMRELYEQAASQVINSGACDKVQRVDQCPAYMAVEAHFAAAMAVCK